MEFHKYTKIRILGNIENKDIFSDPEDEIIIVEKIDGANFRFYINEQDKNNFNIDKLEKIFKNVIQ